MDINIILVPYDSGHRAWRMGSGPGHLLHNGLETALREKGHTISTSSIEAHDPYPSEVKTAFELYRGLAEKVHVVRRAGNFPVVLSGNCGAAIGAVAGISDAPTGVIWFDAHGDFNTPETTRSGFLDGMGLAILCGMCWNNLANTIPHFRPVPTNRVLHIGGIDLDPEEIELMERCQVRRVATRAIQAQGLDSTLAPALDLLADEVKHLYLHIDLDVLDPAVTPANHFPVPGGLAAAVVQEAIRMIETRFTIRGVGLSSYDPASDPHGNTLRAGIELIETVTEG